MIKSIKFLKDFRTFKAGEVFEFRPGVNVLVGDQGTGKSTLIELIRTKLEPVDKNPERDSSWRARHIRADDISSIIEIDATPDCKCKGYDFERESAKDMSTMLYDMMDIQVASMRSSHGESNSMSLNRILTFLKNTPETNVVLFDEPDSALSPRSCYALLLILHNIHKIWKRQVIVSAHNPIIIRGQHPILVKDAQNLWDEVLSLEDKKWMRGSDFLLFQLLPRKSDEKPEDKKIKKE